MMPTSLNFVLRIFALGLAWQAAAVRIVVKEGAATLEQDEDAQPIPRQERSCPKLVCNRRGKIISLMGTSSAGKSAISSALGDYLKLSIDNMHEYSYGEGMNLPGFQSSDVVTSMNTLWDYAQWLANKFPDLNIIMDQVYPMPEDWFCEIHKGHVIPVFLFANREVLELNVERRSKTEWRHISEPLRHADTYFQWKDVPGESEDPSYVGNFGGKGKRKYAYLKQAYRRNGIDHVLPPHQNIVVIENVKSDLNFEAASQDLAKRLREAAEEKGYTL